MIYKTIYSFKLYKNSDNAPIVVLPKYIGDVTFSQTNTFQKETELMTGVADVNGAVLEIIKPKTGQATDLEEFLERTFDWRMTRLDIYVTNDGNVNNLKMIYSGLLFVRKETDTKVTFTTRNFLDLLNITLVETPLLRNRRVATFVPTGTTDADKFTKLKAQNPTILEGSSVGIVNALLWLIGGRPYKYKSLYDTQYTGVAGQYPKFYYDCDASIINPEWLWFNYENLYGDLSLLCKSAGGILNQDFDGVVRFKNVFSTKETWNGLTLTDSNFASVDIAETGTEPYSKIVTTFTPRYLSGSQEVFSTVINEYLNYEESVERQIQFNKPIYKLVNKTISGQLTDTIVGDNFKFVKDKMNVVDSFGTRQIVEARIKPHSTLYITKYQATDTIGNFTKVKDPGVVPSQSTTIYIKNTLNQASTVYVGEVSLYGRALESGTQETYMLPLNQYPTVSGFKELRLPDNPYMQSESQAIRVINIAKYLMEYPRLSLTVDGVAYTDKIKLGETILLNSATYAISGEFKITSISFSSTLSTVNLGLLSMSGLYAENEIFQVGTTYADGNSRVLAF
jgi:hypothetical protein